MVKKLQVKFYSEGKLNIDVNLHYCILNSIPESGYEVDQILV